MTRGMAGTGGVGIQASLLKGSILLTAGSLLLLSWSLQVLSTPGASNPALLVGLFTYPALLAHFGGWWYLWRASRRSARLRWIFLGSLFGFALGIVTMPWVAPRGLVADTSDSGTFLVTALRAPLFPYIPSVFAPVVVPHGLIFVFFGRSLRRRSYIVTVLAGAGYLMALAAIGLLLQGESLILGRATNDLFLILAGLTSIGYALFALSWRLDASWSAMGADGSGSPPTSV